MELNSQKRVRIFLIRHGKTSGNIEKRYIGKRTDISLSKEGIEELKALSPQYRSLIEGTRNSLSKSSQDDLCSEKTIYLSGSMKRCRESMETLFKGKKYHVIEDLREIDFGDFEGYNYKELSDNPDYQKWIGSNGTIAFPNGEGREEFIRNTMVCFNDIMETYVYNTYADNKLDCPDNLVIVCHGGNIMAIMSTLTGEDYFSFQCQVGQGYILDMEAGKGVSDVISFNRIFAGLPS
ncbi:MAG: histidine phosphatase family protein [Eubacterium sp.]|nr:histidine phosphatase family protein [Eubacterium sp.]